MQNKENNKVYKYPYNNPVPRPSVSMMARPFPSSHQFLTQEMARQDIDISRSQYTTPSQVSSDVNSIGTVTIATDYGFTTQGFMLDSATLTRNSFGASPNSFHDGRIVFQFPIIGSVYSITNVVAVEGLPFFIPQVATDTSIHPEYLYNQYIGVLISECTNDTNTFQPVLGNGANIPYMTGPAVGSSLLATPMLQRIAFNTPIREINQFTLTFYRNSSNPGNSTLEPIYLPKTNIEAKYVAGSGNIFRVSNADSVSEFIDQPSYIAGSSSYKAGVYINYTTASPRSSDITSLITSPSGWYASGFDYIGNTFQVDGLNLIPVESSFSADTQFVFTIMPNRIIIQFNFISRTGTKTNSMTVVL